MAKPQPKKKQSPIKWVLIVGGAAIVYLVAFPGDDAKVAVKPKPKTAKKGPADDYTKEDRAAAEHPFLALKGPVVDAFRPTIVRPGAGGPGNLPLGIAGPGWSYSGMAVVDGVGRGLLENSVTGESVFLTRGQTWESSKVTDFDADHIVLIGPDGPVTVNVEIKDSKESGASATVAAANTSAALPLPAPPVTVPLRGDIGTQDVNLGLVQDNSAADTTPRRRGRRRNAG